MIYIRQKASFDVVTRKESSAITGINFEAIEIGTEIYQLFLSRRHYISLAKLVFCYTTLKSDVLPLEHQ